MDSLPSFDNSDEFSTCLSVLEKGSKELIVTFDDDSPSGDRWLGQFIFDEQNAQFAGGMTRVMPLWGPKPTERPIMGFAKSP